MLSRSSPLRVKKLHCTLKPHLIALMSEQHHQVHSLDMLNRTSFRLETSSHSTSSIDHRAGPLSPEHPEHDGAGLSPPIHLATVPDEDNPSKDIIPADTDLRDEERRQEELEAGSGKSIGGTEEVDPFDRFTQRKKYCILAIVSYAAFISRKS